MSVFETEQIDTMGIMNENLELSIIDTCDWKYEDEHFDLLEDKLNHYLLYLDSKQYIQKYGDNFNEIIISIHFMYDLVENAVKYLNVVSQQLAEARYSLYIHHPILC